MNIGEAIEHLKEGKAVRRQTAWWNGFGRFMMLLTPEDFVTVIALRIDLQRRGGQWSTWTPTTEDLLATDWETVETPFSKALKAGR